MSSLTLISLDDGAAFTIDREPIVIGRSQRSVDLLIDDPFVSKIHCEIRQNEDGFVVQDKSKHGTVVNGQNVDAGPLSDGDLLRILSYEFRVSLPNSAELTSREWMIRMAGMELGPVPWDELEQMVERGEIRPDDEVRAIDTESWQAIESIEALLISGLKTTASGAIRINDRDESTTFSFGGVDDDEKTQEFELPSDTDTDQDSTESYEAIDLDAVGQMPAENPNSKSVTDTIGEAQSLSDTTPQLATVTSDESSAAGDDSNASVDSTKPHIEPVASGNPQQEIQSHLDPSTLSPEPIESPEAELPEEEEAGEYFYRIGTLEDGPVGFSVLKQLVDRQRIAPTDEVRIAEGAWEIAAGIPNLFMPSETREQLTEREQEPAYDSSMLDVSVDEITGDDAARVEEDAVPFNEPIERRVAFHPPSGGNQTIARRIGRATRRPPGRIKEWTSGIIGHVQSNRLVAATCLIVLGILIYWVVPKQHGFIVRGLVKLDGAPLKNSQITFRHQDTGLETTFPIDNDGNFETRTLEGGLAAGKYKVCFMPRVPESAAVVEQLQIIFQQQRGFDPNGETTQVIDMTDPETNTDPEYRSNKVRLPRGTIPVHYRTIESSNTECLVESEDVPINFTLVSPR